MSAIGTKRFLRVGRLGDARGNPVGEWLAEFGTAERRVTCDEVLLRYELATNRALAVPLDDEEEVRGLRAILHAQNLKYDSLATVRRHAKPTPEPAALADMFPEAR